MRRVGRYCTQFEGGDGVLTYWSHTDGICSVDSVMKITQEHDLVWRESHPLTIVTAVVTMEVGFSLGRCMLSKKKRISKAEL